MAPIWLEYIIWPFVFIVSYIAIIRLGATHGANLLRKGYLPQDSSVFSLPYHDSESFTRLYNKFRPICTRMNIVLPRYNASDNTSSYHREWSMNTGLVQRYMGHDKSTSLNPPFCNNSLQLESALTQPVDKLPCGLSWYSRDGICAVLDKYESVVLFGDSLTRMILQGFVSLLKGDLRFGGRQSVASNSSLTEVVNAMVCSQRICSVGRNSYKQDIYQLTFISLGSVQLLSQSTMDILN